LQPLDAQAPLELQGATGAQYPLKVPETDVAEAQAEVLKSADAQAVAKVSEVGAQALLEVSKVVDVIAQEVVDEQATVNGDITAGDDNAAAPLDAVDPKQ
ncbi:unnamed protein product, partial [Aphanomyces euteiches]